jgi:hypothetical protein
MDEMKILQDVCFRIEEKRGYLLQVFKTRISSKYVRTELEKISNRDRPEWKCFSPLVSAVRAKRKDLIKLMIEDLGFDIDSICTETVLSFGVVHLSGMSIAIDTDDEDMVKFLVVEMKAKVENNQTGVIMQTPMLLAVAGNHLEIVKILVEELGADVNFNVSKTQSEFSPFLALHWAIYQETQ